MTKICQYCGKEFETRHRNEFCTRKCHLTFVNHQRFPDGTGYIECKICGQRGHDLNKHVNVEHNMTAEEYCAKFNLQLVDLQSPKMRKHNSEMQKLAVKEGRLHGWGKGDANPSRRKEVREGRKSIFSKNCEKYDGLTDEEKEQKIQELLSNIAKEKAENHNNPLTIDYYTSRGLTEKEARAKLKERQSTFSLEKCIEKYGEEKGTEIFEARQKKWQNTLNSKSPEEIERINKAKMCEGRGYSKISQKMFNEIVAQLKPGEFKHIYYATNNPTKRLNEFTVHDIQENKKSHYFLDFYIEDNNKVIEFDGDYWHGIHGNTTKEQEREDRLRELGYVNILHVKERDYNNDPAATVKKCLDFIRA